MITLEERDTVTSYQASCPECGPIGKPMTSESAADELLFAHRAAHPDTEDDSSI